MKFAGIYIYITWQYNGFLVLMVVKCTVWCWASLSWHISISQFISCSCQRIGISMRLNTGTYFSFVYFNSLIYFFTLIHFLILSTYRNSHAISYWVLLFLCLFSFPNLFPYADLFPHLVKVSMRRSACSSERNNNQRAEIISSKWFLVRTKAFYDALHLWIYRWTFPHLFYVQITIDIIFTHKSIRTRLS